MNKTFSIIFAFCLLTAVTCDASVQAAPAVEPSAVDASAQNPTPSPDTRSVAYTLGGNLFVLDSASGEVTQITDDGSELILNGYASWVYYEEIFGRPSKYRAFWWSPDSRKLAFYRFDQSGVPVFPIFSPFGQGGELSLTRYPKAGQSNPEVRIGIYSLDTKAITWADFDSSKDQYFGTPFWGDDSKQLFVQWMPRVQNTLELYAVAACDGSLKHIYHEEYPTWVDWMDDMLFGRDGLYMARAFESGWQQLYYLSYDGKTFKRLTDGCNWRINLVRLDERRGDVYFTACRENHLRRSLYKLAKNGKITRLSPLEYNVANVSIADDFKSYQAEFSNVLTPAMSVKGKTAKESYSIVRASDSVGEIPSVEFISLAMADGLQVPAKVTYPFGFDPSQKYPVVMEIYGGPDTDYVYDRWRAIRPMEKWYAENGIVRVVADCRASGHNGRAGEDLSWRDVVSAPVEDFSRWAEYLGSLPWVDEQRIGVEGFSFGGTMTAMLVMTRPDLFRCGVAGGGVYDWALYDTHYTERFMDTPQRNPEGYRKACALNYVGSYNPTEAWLKLTHGTGDDNVHFQNTLQLVDALQQAGKQFDLMIYPDGMHGYRNAQASHDNEADKRFWTEHLLND